MIKEYIPFAYEIDYNIFKCCYDIRFIAPQSRYIAWFYTNSVKNMTYDIFVKEMDRKLPQLSSGWNNDKMYKQIFSDLLKMEKEKQIISDLLK